MSSRPKQPSSRSAAAKSTRRSTAFATYSDKDRARAGCIVTIGDDGEFCLHQGLVDRAAIRGSDAGDDTVTEDDDDGDDAFTPDSDDEDDDHGPRPSTPGAEQALRKECGFTQSLVDDLKAHRLQITRAHLAPAIRRRVRSRALCALRRSVRSFPLPRATRSICARPKPLRAAH